MVSVYAATVYNGGNLGVVTKHFLFLIEVRKAVILCRKVCVLALMETDLPQLCIKPTPDPHLTNFPQHLQHCIIHGGQSILSA